MRRPTNQESRMTPERLATSPDARLYVANRLGMRTSGSMALAGRCPWCARQSVAFTLTPSAPTGAVCLDIDACGWQGPLDDLVDIIAIREGRPA